MEYSFEFFALVLFVVVLAGILWILEKTSEAGRNIMATLDSVKSDEQQVAEELALEKRQRLEELDAYNEACNMEPFCGGSDAHARSRAAVARAQEAARASMKP